MKKIIIKETLIIRELLLSIDLINVLRAGPLYDHHEECLFVIHYVRALLLHPKLIIKRSLPSYFLLLLVQTFLLLRMSN